MTWLDKLTGNINSILFSENALPKNPVKVLLGVVVVVVVVVALNFLFY